MFCPDIFCPVCFVWVYFVQVYCVLVYFCRSRTLSDLIRLRFICFLTDMKQFVVGICYVIYFTSEGNSSLTTRPQNATKFVRESVEFHCGSNATVHGTTDLVPVNWEFSGEKDCVFCIGTLTYKYIGRYYVNTSAVGEYTLRLENITQNDSGIYTCIDDAGFGPDEASAALTVAERVDDVVKAHVTSVDTTITIIIVLVTVGVFILTSLCVVVAIKIQRIYRRPNTGQMFSLITQTTA